MHVVYLACDVDTAQTTDKLAAWDVMTRANRVFGEISGTVLTSKNPGESFVMKLTFHNFDNFSAINQAKFNKLLNELKRECGISNIDVHKETQEEKDLFAEYENNESTKPKIKTLDEDLGSITFDDRISPKGVEQMGADSPTESDTFKPIQ